MLAYHPFAIETSKVQERTNAQNASYISGVKRTISTLVDQTHIHLTRQRRKKSFFQNKRLSQQPALGALTFLRSFVAGKANFCSHLLASLVHFTVVKSKANLSIRFGVIVVIYSKS